MIGRLHWPQTRPPTDWPTNSPYTRLPRCDRRETIYLQTLFFVQLYIVQNIRRSKDQDRLVLSGVTYTQSITYVIWCQTLADTNSHTIKRKVGNNKASVVNIPYPSQLRMSGRNIAAEQIALQRSEDQLRSCHWLRIEGFREESCCVFGLHWHWGIRGVPDNGVRRGGRQHKYRKNNGIIGASVRGWSQRHLWTVRF